jgi:spermidine synthase
MTATDLEDAATTSAPPRFLPLLLVLFVGSGCSALICEIVWFQLLEFLIGSSAVSLAVLLGTFMGGMCLGSLALPRLLSTRRHPLRVYAALEFGIGIFGILIVFGMPYLDRLYAAGVGSGLTGFLGRGAVCAACLLPPTLLMGATLPAIARWIETTPQGVAWLGLFYGGNIAGAVFGCLLAGFYLLRVHDMATAACVAAGINAAVAVSAFVLAAWAPHSHAADGPEPARTGRTPGSILVYIVIGLSGLSALSAEVIWTRLLSLMLGATVYTFSIILAVFLVGLGIGSSIGSFLGRRTARPRLALGCCQLLLALAIAWSAFMLAESLPYWPIVPSLAPSPWLNFQLDLARCFWALLPATILWGASFPLALAAVASAGQDPGRLVGGVYAANTAGAIVGAVATSLVLIPNLGTHASQRLLIGLSAATAFSMLVWSPRWSRQEAFPDGRWRRLLPWVVAACLLIGVGGLAAVLAWTVPPMPGQLVAYGRQLPSRLGEADMLYVGEGINATVAVSQWEKQTRYFHISGKTEASTVPEDMRLQRMLGHLSALFHPRPRSVLVVGCGAGVTAGTFVLHPEVERIVICELEPLIPKVVAQYFAQENYDVLHNSRVEVVFDDARHFILTTPEKFDVITSDPIHPWVKGAATLYTREYFELCRRHLNPGGLVTQWVPLYETDFDTVKSEIATFMDAFPEGTIWSNSKDGKGYDVVLLGQDQPAPIDVDVLRFRLYRDDHSWVERSLQEVGLGGAVNLLATYAGRGPDLKSWLEGAAINRDRNLRLQYLAGMGLNSNRAALIYQDMLWHRRFPEDLFTGSEEQLRALRKLLESTPSGS